jgi:hypothetical protein
LLVGDFKLISWAQRGGDGRRAGRLRRAAGRRAGAGRAVHLRRVLVYSSANAASGSTCAPPSPPARIPTSEGTRLVKRFGYGSKAETETAALTSAELLGLAADDLPELRYGRHGFLLSGRLS